MKQKALVLSLVLTIALGIALPALSDDNEAVSGFSADFVNDLERVGGRLVQLAEAIPADKFGWAPSEGVRTVSEVYMHVVGVNFFMPSGLGAAPPEGMEMPENPMAFMQEMEANVTSQAEVVKKLKASFEYAAAAVPSVTDLETEIDMFGFPASKRAYLFILMNHAHEHLGQSIAYARSIGVTPPWSQPQGDDG